MQLLKRIIYFVFTAILITILMASFNVMYAGDTRPLEETSPIWTGLKTSVEANKQGDRALAGALDTELKEYGIEPASLPLKVDYSDSEYLPPVGRQNENSCVGWSVGYYLRTYQQAKDIGWEVRGSDSGIDRHIFSPSFIYNQINEGVDEGAYIEDAAELLKNQGAATLEWFPYIPGDYYTKPDEDTIQSAYPHRIREWRVLFTQNDSSQYIIQKTKEYLNTGDLVVAGSRIGSEFLEPHIDRNGNSIITTDYFPSYNHSYVIVGYDDSLVTFDGIGAFKLVNSWGREWGNEGFSYISYKAFTANAIEGFVFTDLVNGVQEELNVDVISTVAFNMDFSGKGRFDIKIKDESNELIYEESNLPGEQGVNTFTWNGKDSGGNIAGDGVYKLSVITYKNNTPKPSFEYLFNKAGKIERASGSAYIYEDVIRYVDIPITFKSDGILNIKIVYNDAKHDIISSQAVKAGESKIYRIQKKEFDFNNKDLEQIRVIIEIQ